MSNHDDGEHGLPNDDHGSMRYKTIVTAMPCHCFMTFSLGTFLLLPSTNARSAIREEDEDD